VLASLALVPAAIGVLAPAGPDDGCPSPRQVTDALAARLPGSVIPLGQPIGAGALRLAVSGDASSVTRVDLTDGAGEVLLRRTLSAADRARATDCPALAETVALIVERYWREVGYDVPPLPPPRPPPEPEPPPPEPAPAKAEVVRAPAPPPPPSGPWWGLGATVGGRYGDTGAWDGSVSVVGTLERRLGWRLQAGVAGAWTADSSVGVASFRRFPIRLGAYYPISVGVGQLEPGVGIGLDPIYVGLTDFTTATFLEASQLCFRRWCVSPGADVALGWSVRSTRHVYLRALARAGIAVPYQFVTGSETIEPNSDIWSTPRTYLELGIESGLWFH
jgi:hypothetical protein